MYIYKCGKCGRVIPRDSARCPYCGVRLAGVRPASTTRRTGGKRPSSKQSKGGVAGTIIGIVLVAVIAIAALTVLAPGLTERMEGFAADLQAEATVAVAEPAVAAPTRRPTQRPTQTPTEPPATATPAPDADPYAAALAGVFAGETITFMAPEWEAEQFALAVDGFAEASGITVEIIAYDDVTAFETQVAAGDGPALAATANWQLLQTFTNLGTAVDLREALGEDVLAERIAPAWQALGEREGPDGPLLAGLPHHVTPHSMVFYPQAAFEAAGYTVPATWGELMALSDEMVANGETPWCVGVESGGATGWITTNWLEDVLLRLDPATYDAWAAGAFGVGAPQMAPAWEALMTVWFSDGYVYGGGGAIQATSFFNSPGPLFDDPPGCWFHLQAPFIAGAFPEEAEFGTDYGCFTLPPMSRGEPGPMVVTGTMLVLFDKRPAARAVMHHLLRSESAAPWLEDSVNIAVMNGIAAEDYGTPLAQAVAPDLAAAAAAGLVRADASSILPPGRGGTALWTELNTYVDQFAEVVAADRAVAAEAGGGAGGGATADAAPTAPRAGEIAALVADGALAVDAEGVGIDTLKAIIENLLDEALTVEIPAGTLFVAGSGGVQNMAVRRARTVEVGPGEIVSLLLDVACANMERDVPDQSDRFQVQAAGAQMGRLMETLSEAGAPYDVVQAAVWILTNNANYADLGTLVSGFTNARVINHTDAAWAMQLVDASGIDITGRRIWADREAIAAGAEGAPAAWLAGRL